MTCILATQVSTINKDGAELIVVHVSLPLASRASDVDVEVEGCCVTMTMKGCCPLKALLPCAVDDSKAKAKFDCKTKILRVSFPMASC